MKKILFLLLITTSLQAQVSIRVIDSSTDNPIEGVQVSFIQNKKTTQVAVSDANGNVKANVSLPITIEVSHVSFENQKLILTDPELVIYLKPSNVILDDIVVTGQLRLMLNIRLSNLAFVSCLFLKIFLKNNEKIINANEI